MNYEMLLLIEKVTDTLIEQRKTKPQEPWNLNSISKWKLPHSILQNIFLKRVNGY